MERGTRFKAHGYTDDEQKTSWSLIPDKTGPYVYDPIDQKSASDPPTEPGWYDLTTKVKLEHEESSGYLIFQFPHNEDWLDIDDVEGQWSPIKEPDKS